MKTISDIYNDLCLPEQLQMHMLRVCAVGLMLTDHWSKDCPSIRVGPLTRILLFHDVGNLVKIGDLDRQAEARRDELTRQFDTTDDHALSERIAAYYGLSEYEVSILRTKVFVNNQEIFDSNDYTLKVAAYADQRVTPNGVASLLGRLLEAKDRYVSRPGTSMNRPDTNLNIELATRIEEQVFACVRGISPSDITDESIADQVTRLRLTTI